VATFTQPREANPSSSLLIFDLDGTLIDSRLDLANAVNATRAEMGRTALEHPLIFSYVGNGAPVARPWATTRRTKT
jgi:phosphoglycolate phosphatase-like HAD superfamily hydrolase